MGASPPRLAPPCLQRIQTWETMNMTWKVRSNPHAIPVVILWCKCQFMSSFFVDYHFRAFKFMPSCLLCQVMWMKKWRRSSPSTCSLELALAPDPLLSLHHAVVLVLPPPMEKLQPPAGLVAHNNPPDHPKVNAACATRDTHPELDCFQ